MEFHIYARNGGKTIEEIIRNYMGGRRGWRIYIMRSFLICTFHKIL
jgi:hypothetical protein